MASSNQLLAALPEADYRSLQPYLTRVDLAAGQVLYQSGALIEDCYFLNGGLASLAQTAQDGTLVEFSAVGREGVLGIGAISGSEHAVGTAIVEITGTAWRIAPAELQEQFRHSYRLQDLLLRYLQFLMSQTSQTAYCNLFHPKAQRLSRWLLLVAERVQADEFAWPLVFMAHMLGSDHDAASAAVAGLERAGFIRYQNTRITILDRAGLEQSACECLAIIRQRAEAVLGD